MGKPWPNGPVLVSTPGTLVRFGCPFSGDNGPAKSASAASGKKPAAASVT